MKTRRQWRATRERWMVVEHQSKGILGRKGKLTNKEIGENSVLEIHFL